MLINVSKLTDIIDGTEFISWVNSRFPNLYKNIIAARDAGESGQKLQSRIIGLYNQIYSDNKARDSFRELINKHYPQILSDEVEDVPISARLMAPPGDDPNGVFSFYHPNLLRLPMQIMFHSEDQSRLQQAVKLFISRLRTEYEVLFIGEFGYIEYIPSNAAKFMDKVGDSNWEIKNWKAKNNMVNNEIRSE